MDEEQVAVIGLIGVTLKMIADKAYAYEQIMVKFPPRKTNDFQEINY